MEFQGRTADDYYSVGTHTIKVRAKDEAGFYSDWLSVNFTVKNAIPTVTITVTPTRTIKNGKFLVNINASAADADGDATTMEFQGRTADDYYSVGTHTIKVRAKDEAGFYSDWLVKTFTITNEAPTAPVISRSPNTNSVAPGTVVTITAQSSDPEGDAISYVWENRNSETQTYPLGTPLEHKEGILSHPEGVDLLPANIELSGMEVSLINAMSRETILKQYLDTVKKDYQYILLDTQPSLGMLTVNARAAADSVIIPVQAQYLPAKGLEQLLQTIKQGA